MKKHKLKKAITEEFGVDINDLIENMPPYFVFQSSIIKRLPIEDRRLFAGLIQKIRDEFDLSHAPKRWQVSARDEDGLFCKDPYVKSPPPKKSYK